MASAETLPFGRATSEAVYCGHLLEHLDLSAGVPALLREVRRILAPGGTLCVVGPDHDLALANPEWHPLLPGIRYGGARWPGDTHLWLSTGPRALAAMLPVFPSAALVDITMLRLEGWPLMDDVGWQFAILATA